MPRRGGAGQEAGPSLAEVLRLGLSVATPRLPTHHWKILHALLIAQKWLEPRWYWKYGRICGMVGICVFQSFLSPIKQFIISPNLYKVISNSEKLHNL